MIGFFILFSPDNNKGFDEKRKLLSVPDADLFAFRFSFGRVIFVYEKKEISLLSIIRQPFLWICDFFMVENWTELTLRDRLSKANVDYLSMIATFFFPLNQ